MGSEYFQAHQLIEYLSVPVMPIARGTVLFILGYHCYLLASCLRPLWKGRSDDSHRAGIPEGVLP